MTRKTRTLLFLLVTFLFLLTAPSVVLYTQGYRIDTERKKITQTGGISVIAFPKSARVYIDGKLKKNTSFLSGRTFIQSVLPGIHLVTVKKDGYTEWQKELEVREKQVTEAHNVIILPKDSIWNSLAENIKNYWPSPSGNLMLLEREAAGSLKLELFDTKNNTYTELQFVPSELRITGSITNVTWSTDESRAILESSSKTYPYLISDFDSREVSGLAWPMSVTEMALHPLDKNKVLVLSPTTDLTNGGYPKNTLWEYDRLQKTSQAVLQNILGFAATSEGIIWLDQEGYLNLSTFSGTIMRPLIKEAHSVWPSAPSYRIYALNPQKILVMEGRALFGLHPVTKVLAKFGDNVQKIVFSPDQKKAAFSTDHEVWILYLEAQTGQPVKQAGDYALLTRFSEKIEDIIWMGSNYIILKFANNIKVAEIDDRDGINIIDVALPENSEEKLRGTSFNQTAKHLYILLGEEIFRSRKLLP